MVLCRHGGRASEALLTKDGGGASASRLALLLAHFPTTWRGTDGHGVRVLLRSRAARAVPLRGVMSSRRRRRWWPVMELRRP